MVMTNTRAPLVLEYPTPAMEQMTHDIRNDILFLRQWFDAPAERDSIYAPTEVTPVTVLATLAKVIESVEPALRFFLNYPTQRLSVFLLKFVSDAQSFVCWFSTRAGTSKDPSLTEAM